MKHFVIFNPGSKDGKSKKKIEKIISLLKENGINFDYKITEKLDDAYQFSKEANLKSYDVIVAVGGDGTINNAINGFYDSDGKIISNASFGVICTGTSPDFCKSYNIPIKINEAIKTIKNNESKPIKLGKINLKKDKSNYSDLTTRYFACCANIGLGATLAINANSGVRKYLGDFLGTFFSLIKTLFIYKPNDFEIIIDNNKKKIKKLFNLSVGKTYYIASGIKVKNDLNEVNKKFYILMVRNLKLTNIFSVIKKIYSGKQFKNDDFINLSYCDQIEIKENNDNPDIEFDGDPTGFLPCKIEEAREPLNIICNL